MYHPNPELHALGLLLCGADYADVAEALKMRGAGAVIGRVLTARRGGIIGLALAVLSVGANYSSVGFVLLAGGCVRQLASVQFLPRDRRWTFAARLRLAVHGQQCKWWEIFRTV